MSGKRVLVQDEIFEEFQDALISKVTSLQVGNPLEEAYW